MKLIDINEFEWKWTEQRSNTGYKTYHEGQAETICRQ